MAKRATERSAACATCGKDFARSDTLLRHEKSHHATEDRGPIHRVTHGTFRACRLCAQARSRCSGGTPCGRCKTRNLECTYPNKRRKGSNLEDDGPSSFNVVTMSAGAPSEPTQPQQQFAGQFQQFVFASTPNQGYAGSTSSDLGRTNSGPDMTQARQINVQSQQPGSSNIGLTSNMSATTPQVPDMGAATSNLQSVSALDAQIQHPDQYNNGALSVGYPNTFGDSQTNYGAQNLYDDSFGLNWIPLSVYPSPYGDMEQDFSFLIPSLSDSASISNNYDSLTFDHTMSSGSRRDNGEGLHPTSAYQPPASISGLIQSPASVSTGSENIVPTGFSFENVEVPDPRKKRRKLSQIPTGFSSKKEIQNDFAFPDMSTMSPSTGRSFCSKSQYAQIFATFQRLCVNSSRWKPFTDANLPGIAAFNTCIELYFEHLHKTFPLIHYATFESHADWLTCLATAAIGSTFAPVTDFADAREAFQEFLRRSVLATTDEHDGDFRNIHLAQARILALIGLAQSDREQLRSRAPRAHADIARWCLESSILQLTAPDEEVRSDEDIDAAWNRWIQRESLRRVGYFIWYLDCALGYMGNARPLCNMDDARAALPCPESLWNAPTAQKWLVHRNNTPPMPSLCAALEMMYNNKKIDSDLSEISQILLIHALYSRTWEVGTHIKQPLSEWKATGDSRGFLNTPSKDDFWLPLYPLYANWRNSACDCLDVLHWQAAAVMAGNAGAEHHGVLHLHLARIVLLTPFQEIQDLLFFLINHRVSDLSKASFYVHDGSYQPRNPAKLAQIRKITWRWLREDQYKARLAVIHAGSVFWHVRRFSTHSFFEPLAIYLASIVLWTYGNYKSAALERDAAAGHSGYNAAHSSNTKQLQSQPMDRSSQVQILPGADSNVQPTRIELAVRDYNDAKSRSSRSHSHRNTSTTSSKSPAHYRNSHRDTPSQPITSPAAALHHQHQAPLKDTTSSPFAVLSHNYNHNNTNNHTEARDSSPSPSTTSSSSEEEPPAFMHLDRPCDDDLVKHFVRNGHNISGHMSNVGDICKSPQKILLEGAKILRSRLACWGVSREYHDILVRLAELRKDKDRDKDKQRGTKAGSRRHRNDGDENENENVLDGGDSVGNGNGKGKGKQKEKEKDLEVELDMEES